MMKPHRTTWRWFMHNEAAPHYVEMVDQTTCGHERLKKHFGGAAIPQATSRSAPSATSQRRHGG